MRCATTAPASRSAASRPSGLLEMSRQRLRPSLLEHSTEICPHCAGTGRVRSIESAALHALRAIEEEGVRRRAGEIVVSVPPNVALYLLNQKRHTLTEIEQRYGFHVIVEADDELHAADCEIERVRGQRRDRDRPALGAGAARATTRSRARPGRRSTRPMRSTCASRRWRAMRAANAARTRTAAAVAGGGAGGARGATARAKATAPIVRRPLPARTIRPTSRRMTTRPNGAAADGHDEQGEEPREAPHDGPRDGEAVHADGERNGDGNRRRRGRRGGRRRRRENGDGAPGDHAPREHGHHEHRGITTRATRTTASARSTARRSPMAAIRTRLPRTPKQRPRRRRSTTCRSTRWRAGTCRSSARPTIPVRR